MALTEAFGKIRGIASSYLSHPSMLRAKGIASSLAHSPAVMGGAAVGAVTGSVNYRDRSIGWSPMGALKGAALGAAAGAAYKGYGAMGGKSGMLHQYGRASGAAMRGADTAMRGADRAWTAARRAAPIDNAMYRMGMGPR